VTRVGRRGQWRPAAGLPVARVAVDVSLAHLDRPFDYQVPEHLDADARPGVRVRIRFAGRLVDGVLLERAAVSDHAGRLGWLERVVSPEPVLGPELALGTRQVYDVAHNVAKLEQHGGRAACAHRLVARLPKIGDQFAVHIEDDLPNWSNRLRRLGHSRPHRARSRATVAAQMSGLRHRL